MKFVKLAIVAAVVLLGGCAWLEPVLHKPPQTQPAIPHNIREELVGRDIHEFSLYMAANKVTYYNPNWPYDRKKLGFFVEPIPPDEAIDPLVVWGYNAFVKEFKKWLKGQGFKVVDVPCGNSSNCLEMTTKYAQRVFHLPGEIREDAIVVTFYYKGIPVMESPNRFVMASPNDLISPYEKRVVSNLKRFIPVIMADVPKIWDAHVRMEEAVVVTPTRRD